MFYSAGKVAFAIIRYIVMGMSQDTINDHSGALLQDAADVLDDISMSDRIVPEFCQGALPAPCANKQTEPEDAALLEDCICQGLHYGNGNYTECYEKNCEVCDRLIADMDFSCYDCAGVWAPADPCECDCDWCYEGAIEEMNLYAHNAMHILFLAANGNRRAQQYIAEYQGPTEKMGTPDTQEMCYVDGCECYEFRVSIAA